MKISLICLGLTGILTLAGCSQPKDGSIQKGIIEKEFFDSNPLAFDYARYSALVKLANDKEVIVMPRPWGQSASRANMKYDVGDSVEILLDRKGQYVFADKDL